MSKTIYIASDHGGFTLKEYLVEHMQNKGYDVHNLGSQSTLSCDYPESARLVVEELLVHVNAMGILVCGTGIGMSMAANRWRGIRAALATCEFHARLCREHNNANVLCLGERVTGMGLAASMVDIFLTTEFEGGRHKRRVEQFD